MVVLFRECSDADSKADSLTGLEICSKTALQADSQAVWSSSTGKLRVRFDGIRIRLNSGSEINSCYFL